VGPQLLLEPLDEPELGFTFLCEPCVVQRERCVFGELFHHLDHPSALGRMVVAVFQDDGTQTLPTVTEQRDDHDVVSIGDQGSDARVRLRVDRSHQLARSLLPRS
jgi:hypothetical protein